MGVVQSFLGNKTTITHVQEDTASWLYTETFAGLGITESSCI